MNCTIYKGKTNQYDHIRVNIDHDHLRISLIQRLRQSYSQNKWLLTLLIWLSIVPLFSSSALTFVVIDNESILQTYNRVDWAIIFCFISITMSIAITPTTFIAIVTGYFLGWKSIIPIVLTYQSASYIGYLLASKVNHAILTSLLRGNERALAIMNNVHRNELKVVILSRISPVLPFALMNVVLSVSGIKLRNFLLGGLVGMLPRTLFFIWIGMQAQELIQAIHHKENLVWIGLITLVVFALFYLVLKPIQRKTP